MWLIHALFSKYPEAIIAVLETGLKLSRYFLKHHFKFMRNDYFEFELLNESFDLIHKTWFWCSAHFYKLFYIFFNQLFSVQQSFLFFTYAIVIGAILLMYNVLLFTIKKKTVKHIIY